MSKQRPVFLSVSLVVVLALPLAGCRWLRRIPAGPSPASTQAAFQATPTEGAPEAGGGAPGLELAITTEACAPPEGWAVIAVEEGETLSGIAARYELEAQALQRANCLPSADEIRAGQRLYVPFRLPTPTPCAPPGGWVPYVVQAGDTLFDVALRYQLSVEYFKTENCLSTDDIRAGQRLHVPYTLPTATPLPTPTPPPTPTPTPTPCARRADWVSVMVQPGESVYRIALRYEISADDLRQANCLESDTLLAGQTILVPYAIATAVPPPPAAVAARVTRVPPRAPPVPTPTRFVQPWGELPIPTPPPPFTTTKERCDVTHWATYTTSVATVAGVNGFYEVAVHRPDTTIVVSARANRTDETGTVVSATCVITDVAFRIYVRPEAVSQETIYGPICRYDPETQSFYAFLFRGTREYTLAKVDHGVLEHLTAERTWRTHILPHLPKSLFKLVIVCEGSKITARLPLSLADVSVEDPGTPLTQGGIGYVVATGSEAKAAVKFQKGRSQAP